MQHTKTSSLATQG